MACRHARKPKPQEHGLTWPKGLLASGVPAQNKKADASADHSPMLPALKNVIFTAHGLQVGLKFPNMLSIDNERRYVNTLRPHS
jgi:hypothetical protein